MERVDKTSFQSAQGLGDRDLMLLAIEEGKKCVSSDTAYNVGAVITKDGVCF